MVRMPLGSAIGKSDGVAGRLIAMRCAGEKCGRNCGSSERKDALLLRPWEMDQMSDKMMDGVKSIGNGEVHTRQKICLRKPKNYQDT